MDRIVPSISVATCSCSRYMMKISNNKTGSWNMKIAIENFPRNWQTLVLQIFERKECSWSLVKPRITKSWIWERNNCDDSSSEGIFDSVLVLIPSYRIAKHRMTELKSITFPHDNSVAFLDFNTVALVSADDINLVDESVENSMFLSCSGTDIFQGNKKCKVWKI